MSERTLTLGATNQRPVCLTAYGLFCIESSEEQAQSEARRPSLIEEGEALYRMAQIINGQYENPFEAAGASLKRLHNARRRLDWVLGLVETGVAPFTENQSRQFVASAGLVLLSIAELQEELEDSSLAYFCLDLYFRLIECSEDPFLKEKLVINLDWVAVSLPDDLTARCLQVIEKELPLEPAYDTWFANDNKLLRVSWKCGPEFLDGWSKRLQKEGYVESRASGGRVLTRNYEHKDIPTQIELHLGPERSDVFEAMGDKRFQVVGYDGHSDWGRKIPESLVGAPAQVGDKALLYFLCCGKQILQKVRDVYPLAHVVTTFNSAKFTRDFSYSEDFSAFMHIMKGFSRRESWHKIRGRVNGDWHNNPEKNYIFPTETLEMARSLDRDHDGQADVFDRLIDYNTFAPVADTANEFEAKDPGRVPQVLVGTSLHLGVQVFHTLSHFNQYLTKFADNLRVFSGGWFDPKESNAENEVDFGIIRVLLRKGPKGSDYIVKANFLYAHGSEEMWRALITYSLGLVVMGNDPLTKSVDELDVRLNALVMVAHGLSIDEALGRDEAVWSGVLSLFELSPKLSLQDFIAAKAKEHHWYAGSKKSIQFLKKNIDHSVLQILQRATSTTEEM